MNQVAPNFLIALLLSLQSLQSLNFDQSWRNLWHYNSSKNNITRCMRLAQGLAISTNQIKQKTDQKLTDFPFFLKYGNEGPFSCGFVAFLDC